MRAAPDRSALQQDAQHAPQRLGSAHSNWSPTVKAPRYWEPMFSLRRRPTGTLRVPVTAAGVSSRTLTSRWFGTSLTQGLCWLIRPSMSVSGTSLFNLMVSAWLWQRMAPTRTQIPSTGIGFLKRARILLVSAWAFHSSRLCPLGSSLSIQGIRLPPSGAPKCSVGKASLRRVSATLRSMSRIALAGLARSSATDAWAAPIC